LHCVESKEENGLGMSCEKNMLIVSQVMWLLLGWIARLESWSKTLQIFHAS